MARNHKQEFNELVADRRLLKAMHKVAQDRPGSAQESTYRETLRQINNQIDEVLDDHNRSK